MLLQRRDALPVRGFEFGEPGCGFRFSGGAAGLGGFEPIIIIFFVSGWFWIEDLFW